MFKDYQILWSQEYDEKNSSKIIVILIYLILVQFNNQTCLDCGAKDDVRLMPGYCHGKMINKHPKNTSRYHPKGR